MIRDDRIIAEDHLLRMRRAARAVIHIPHSSLVIPEAVLDQYLLEPAELEKELLRMTDWYTDELFALPESKAVAVRFPVSRLVVDPERFEDDAREPMAVNGMGVVYTRTSDGKTLRKDMSPSERQRLLRDYYRPHHSLLTEAVASVLECHGRCLIIDAHSFSSKPLPYELDQDKHRPSICLGTDDFHTPQRLVDRAIDLFGRSFDSVAVNKPFPGTIVPDEYLRKNKRVSSIMIEISRSLYMDEETGTKLSCFEEVGTKLESVLKDLIAFSS